MHVGEETGARAIDRDGTREAACVGHRTRSAKEDIRASHAGRGGTRAEQKVVDSAADTKQLHARHLRSVRVHWIAQRDKAHTVDAVRIGVDIESWKKKGPRCASGRCG
jgi:hypothetical protein